MSDKITPKVGQRVRYSGETEFRKANPDDGALVRHGNELFDLPPGVALEVLPDPEPAEITRLRELLSPAPRAYAIAVDAMAALVARLQQEAQHGRLV